MGLCQMDLLPRAEKADGVGAGGDDDLLRCVGQKVPMIFFPFFALNFSAYPYGSARIS